MPRNERILRLNGFTFSGWSITAYIRRFPQVILTSPNINHVVFFQGLIQASDQASCGVLRKDRTPRSVLDCELDVVLTASSALTPHYIRRMLHIQESKRAILTTSYTIFLFEKILLEAPNE